MLIVSDFDGVWRSICLKSIYEAYLEIARHLGRNPSDFWKDAEEFGKWVDYSEWTFNLERMGVSPGSDYSKIVRIFHEICDPKMRMFSWADEIMEDMALRHQMTILSGSISDSIYKSLNGSAKFFSYILGRNHVRNMKPDPEGIFFIMNAVGAKVSETVMIGDTYVDILAGKRAGVKTVAVTWGIPMEQRLLDLKPDLTLDDPQLLKEI